MSVVASAKVGLGAGVCPHYLRLLFTCLHLAGVDPTLTDQLLARQIIAIAYETVEDAAGKLPLLALVSAIAGNMSHDPCGPRLLQT
jgi:alanine dehydrogenase